MTAGPVAIVGAGLAGLRCAGLLAARGVEVEVYEASDGVGGRAGPTPKEDSAWTVDSRCY